MIQTSLKYFFTETSLGVFFFCVNKRFQAKYIDIKKKLHNYMCRKNEIIVEFSPTWPRIHDSSRANDPIQYILFARLFSVIYELGRIYYDPTERYSALRWKNPKHYCLKEKKVTLLPTI